MNNIVVLETFYGDYELGDAREDFLTPVGQHIVDSLLREQFVGTFSFAEPFKKHGQVIVKIQFTYVRLKYFNVSV